MFYSQRRQAVARIALCFLSVMSLCGYTTSSPAVRLIFYSYCERNIWCATQMLEAAEGGLSDRVTELLGEGANIEAVDRVCPQCL
jgi:hypothetical protein